MPHQPDSARLHYLVVHLAGPQVRYETLDGQRYAVATVVPIREGVLNEFYVPAAEIAAFVQSWDGLAIPINHPTNSFGEYVSVNSPTHLAQSIGRFFHAQWEGDRLTGEAWLNIDKCHRLGGEAVEVLRRVEAGEPMECSTAFWAETDLMPGTWQGIPYRGTQKHLRPDHLAILPHTTGACSLEHGCGLRALHGQACACDGACHCEKGAQAMDPDAEEKTPGKLRQALRTLFAFANSPEPEAKEPNQAETSGEDVATDPPAQGGTQESLVTNLTHDDLRRALATAIKPKSNDDWSYQSIEDIEDAYVIYTKGQLTYRQAYTIGENKTVTLSGEPEAVQRVTTYVPAPEGQGAPMSPNVAVQAPLAMKGVSMLTKQELVGRLLTHEHSSWSDEQAPVLLALEERVLEHMLHELERRQQEAPLTLKALQAELNTRDQALKTEYDQKLATHVQRLEEQQERGQLTAYFEQRNWKPEELAGLPLVALRRIHQELDPVSYLGNGLPRIHAPLSEDNLPTDNPEA